MCAWVATTQYGLTFMCTNGCTVPLRRNLTCECERLASLAISQASVICARAQVHASGALPTRESKLASVLEANLARVLASTRKRTREYSQTNSGVLANELASTRKRKREDSQTNMRVLAKENATICNRTRNDVGTLVAIFAGTWGFRIAKFGPSAGWLLKDCYPKIVILLAECGNVHCCRRCSPGWFFGCALPFPWCITHTNPSFLFLIHRSHVQMLHVQPQ